ncbi:plasmid mobilization relaxosome protein MobC [Thalassospira australica]|uniref:plasmid mobilization relaxosome protein MobC n=1 Tax=Thalassospira australica TaxID=1528106 RepID=UPI00051A00F3|nr:plasmid mobilization relaxosome protein MobC [Thalassospira australica]
MKNKTIRFRISDEQYGEILKSASNSDKNLSDWIRESLKISSDKNLVEKKLLWIAEVQKLTREISKIGNNINQISKFANSQRQFQEIESFMDVMDDIREKVHELR